MLTAPQDAVIAAIVTFAFRVQLYICVIAEQSGLDFYPPNVHAGTTHVANPPVLFCRTTSIMWSERRAIYTHSGGLYLLNMIIFAIVSISSAMVIGHL